MAYLLSDCVANCVFRLPLRHT